MKKSLVQFYENHCRFMKDFARILRLMYDKYLENELMQTACALTHRTILALVPVLAMIFAIARGFNVQNFVHDQLLEHFRNQKDAINYAMSFVDTYLEHATDGVFIGVGIVALILTLYFLIDSVEHSFNLIWKCGERTYARKFTDYTAIMFWLPVLMITAFGITVWINTGIRTFFDLPNISTLLKYMFVAINFVIEIAVFTILMMYLPNTVVKFHFAVLSGVVCSVAFEALQYLFELSIYVSSYHAVYGSFAYLPLFLLWVQFSWLICLVGAQLAQAAQSHYASKKAANEPSVADK